MNDHPPLVGPFPDEAFFAALRNLVNLHENVKLSIEFIDKEIAAKKAKRDATMAENALLEEVRVFLQELAKVTRDEITAGLQTVVTLCIQSVFGPDFRFEIEVETKRNSTTVEFFVVNESGTKPIRLRPESRMGGGMVDAVAIGLRYGLLKILNPPPKGPIFLDEPAKMVSPDLIGMIGELLKIVTPLFGKQTILITHHYSLHDIIDNPIYVRQENGVSICESGGNQLSLVHKTFGVRASAALENGRTEAAVAQEE